MYDSNGEKVKRNTVNLKLRHHLKTWTSMLFLAGLIAPSTVLGQSSGDPVMQMVCVDSVQSPNGTLGGGWTVVVTQMSSEKFPASTFIPDQGNDFSAKFPMFENITFLIAVFDETPSAATAADLPTFARGLLERDDASTLQMAEGNRVGSLFSIRWGDEGQFDYDSVDQSQNIYRSADASDARTPVCQTPYELSQ